MYSELNKLGIIGMNRRIVEFMSPLNKRRHYPLVDDKTITAKLAKEHGIPMPENYCVFESYGDIKYLDGILEKYSSFVIKPAKGAQGNGILVLSKNAQGQWQRANGKVVTVEDMRYHILQIVGGLYSLSSLPDKAIVQYKIALHPCFQAIVHCGVPDIRVIVCQGYPIMAMTRLPTKSSDGRANLHQGAIGAGIDIATGRLIHATLANQYIEKHPDTGAPLKGMVVPFWQDILNISAKCYDITGLGYLGVDIVLDADLGPMVLEMNARPGLSIQVANNKGLRPLLEHFGRPTKILQSQERVAQVLRYFQNGTI